MITDLNNNRIFTPANSPSIQCRLKWDLVENVEASSSLIFGIEEYAAASTLLSWT